MNPFNSNAPISTQGIHALCLLTMAIGSVSFWGVLNFIATIVCALIIAILIVVFVIITQKRRYEPWNWICLAIYTVALMLFFGAQPTYPNDEYFIFYIAVKWCAFGLYIPLLFMLFSLCWELKIYTAYVILFVAGVTTIGVSFVFGWRQGLSALIAICPAVFVWIVVVTHVLWMATGEHDYGIEAEEYAFAALCAMVNFAVVCYIFTCSCCRRR